MKRYANVDSYTISELTQQGYTPFDMHFHSHYSMDSIAKLPQVLKIAKKQNIGISVTDHNHYRGSYLAAKSQITPAIPGVEVTDEQGVHSLYYFYDKSELKEFFKKEIKPKMLANPFFAMIKTEEVFEKAEKYNCVVGSPHPYVPGTTGMMKIDITPYMLKRIGVIEGKNGYNLTSNNLKAVEWAQKINKPLSAGSDGHSTFEFGNCLTFLKGHDTDSYLKNLLKGNSIILGKEENMFMKIFMSVEKEERYLHEALKKHKAWDLIENQFMTEYKYFKRKFLNQNYNELHRMHHF